MIAEPLTKVFRATKLQRLLPLCVSTSRRVEGMAKLAADENNSAELRGRMYAELAQYVAPKRKAVEHSGDLTLRHEDQLRLLDE